MNNRQYSQLKRLIRSKPWLVKTHNLKDENLIEIAIEKDPNIIHSIENPSEELKEFAVLCKMKKASK